MKTKIIIASLIGLFATPQLLAQTDITAPVASDKKSPRFFETGMQLYSLDLANVDYYFQGDPKTVRNSFVNGLYFKYFSGKNVLRASLGYTERVYDYKEGVYPMYSSSSYRPSNVSTFRKGEVKVGYQRLFGSKKLSAYFFAELNYSYSQQKGTSGYSYYYVDALYYDYRYNYTTSDFLIERSQLGISKGLGLRWNVVRSLVLNLETNVQYYYYMQQDIKHSTYKQRGLGLNFSPVQFSLGFKF